MRRMTWLAFIKQFFCKHEFETQSLCGFLNEDGWLVPATITKCRKCGKVLKRQ